MAWKVINFGPTLKAMPMTPNRFTPMLSRAKAAFPAVAFFGGFLWDAITLGRSITALDLYILLGYLLVAGGILIWMGRRGSMRGSAPLAGAGTVDPATPAPHSAGGSKTADALHWLREDGPAFTLQFLFGSVFSALTIFYFLSSSYLPGFLLVLALVALLILNEFLESHYHRFTITWTLYGVACILFLNFALPHLVGSIHPVWFFVSTAAGVGIVFALRSLSPKASGSTWPIMGAGMTLILLFLVNAIPPVPLVKKRMAICRGLEHIEGRYIGEMEKPPFYSAWRMSESLVRQRGGEKVFCFTSVFLPTGIQTTLYHRWRFADPRKKEWVQAQRIGFPIHGGRQDGFRGYTYKQNLSPGRWEVRVETESGRVLGTIHFRVEATVDSTMEFEKILLE
ncbi:MAG: conserved rane protein of unknown function [Fibrobacteres bacterium]|nr:conserved rane protein of unknown function [Fibrobacterota bacterium]